MAATPESTKKANKQKLTEFLNDCCKYGSLQGFKFFDFYIRGREELLITIRNELNTGSNTPMRTPSASPWTSMSDLPKSQRTLMLSVGTQRRLSGFGHMNIGLPPASPSEHEHTVRTDTHTMFLVAGYQRYGCPYVWLRSNHERLIKSNSSAPIAKDNPLKMKSTSDWATKDIRFWDVIAELVQLSVHPPPRNPFAVDFNHFADLAPVERLLATAALIAFLETVVRESSLSFKKRVQSDLEKLYLLHFDELAFVTGPQAENMCDASASKPNAAPILPYM
eukprot:Colp12_sorted_trinity150504_noHs@14996